MSDQKKYKRMFNKSLVFCGCLLFLAGCGPSDDGMPRIVSTPSTQPATRPPIIIYPKATTPTPPVTRENVPSDWFPPSSVEKSWRAIIVHHSATENGNATIFDKMHREQNGWDGVGYDFVIGNGTDSGDGEIEVTFRWRKQVPGAHCGGTPGNWANEDGIGICLVGNFDRTTPTSQQMQSLAKLIRFLKKRYGISQVYGHGSTPGAHITHCPGTRFPMTRLKQMIDS